LLDLTAFENIPILRPAEFLAKLLPIDHQLHFTDCQVLLRSVATTLAISARFSPATSAYKRACWMSASNGSRLGAVMAFRITTSPSLTTTNGAPSFKTQPLTNGFGNEDLSFGRHMGGNETVYRFQLGDVYMIED